jgi:hypothetical protein
MLSDAVFAKAVPLWGPDDSLDPDLDPSTDEVLRRTFLGNCNLRQGRSGGWRTTENTRLFSPDRGELSAVF